MFSVKFYFGYPGGDVGLAMRMWERESPQHNFTFTVSFILSV